MKRLVLAIITLLLLTLPVLAQDVVQTQAELLQTDKLYEGLDGEARDLLGDVTPTGGSGFTQGLWRVVNGAFSGLTEGLGPAAKTAGALMAVCLLCSLAQSGQQEWSENVVRVAGALGILLSCTGSFSSMVGLAQQTLDEISSFTTLLLPVLSSVLTASGGFASGAALYVGSTLFFDILVRLLRGLLLPMVYGFLALAAAECAAGDERLKPLRELMGWVIQMGLKGVMYLFTAYLTLTGLVTGGADEAALRAAKATLSTALPVVGGIVSDASESVLAGAALLKNTIGVFGLLAILAIGLTPFLRIGVHFLTMKVTAALGGMFGPSGLTKLLGCVATAMGYLLAMTGSSILMALFSCCCFFKVVGG